MSAMLASNLPSITNVKIPATYTAAKVALAECSRIDECKDWADKAEALASYAKQADDSALRQMADRIQARAIRRCGELLREIEPAKNQHDVSNRAGMGAPTSRKQAAEDAGLSRHQKVTAMRVANVPHPEFEAAVESERPPTVTRLAELGKKLAPLLDLGGRDPKEFALSTQAQGQLRSFAEFSQKVSPQIAVRGAFPCEVREMVEHGKQITRWIERLVEEAQ